MLSWVLSPILRQRRLHGSVKRSLLRTGVRLTGPDGRGRALPHRHLTHGPKCPVHGHRRVTSLVSGAAGSLQGVSCAVRSSRAPPESHGTSAAPPREVNGLP